MKKLVFIVLIALCYVLCATRQVSAQTPVFQSASVSAIVINYTLQLSGVASPYASIVLTTNGAFLQSTVANQNGSFSMQSISIGSKVSTVCFTVVDVKRIGESVTCIPIPPIQSNVVINNIFLPPTLGLYRSQIVEGATAILFGYSMPNARVAVALNNTLVYFATANSTGYYEIKVPGLKAGVYQLSSTAVLAGRPSLVPTKKVTLTAVTGAQQFENTVENVITGAENVIENIEDTEKKLMSSSGWWWVLFLLLPIIFFLFFLLWKRRKKKKENAASKDHKTISNPPIKDVEITPQKFVREE